MKYKPNSDYLFECEILCSGLDAKEIEQSVKSALRDIIKSKNPKFASMSNESRNPRDSSLKLFSAIEELQCVIGSKILHVGRIPDTWRVELQKEMEEKEELDQKRLLHLEDCIMLVIEGDQKNYAIVLDRRGIYTISSSPPK